MDIVKELENIKDLEKDSNKILGNLYFTHFWLIDKYKSLLSQFDITPQQSNILGTLNHLPEAKTFSRLLAKLRVD